MSGLVDSERQAVGRAASGGRILQCYSRGAGGGYVAGHLGDNLALLTKVVAPARRSNSRAGLGACTWTLDVTVAVLPVGSPAETVMVRFPAGPGSAGKFAL